MSDSAGRRFQRLFAADKRSVVIALDHGMEGFKAGFENPGTIIDEVVAGGADVVLTTVGIARAFSKQLCDVALMIRCDGATSPLLERPRELLFDIETVLSLGADGAAAMYFPGIKNGEATMNYFPRLATQGQRWNVPVMAEAMPYGFDTHVDSHDVDKVSDACRMAIENGADLIKTFYTGNQAGFKKVVERCYVPVLVLGGARTNSEEDFLSSIRAAMDAGAAGVVIGRNVWQAPSPRAVTRALVAIVHQDATVDEAMRVLRDA